jgi:dTDP-4-dehydrorhamnose 3,5-epimerase
MLLTECVVQGAFTIDLDPRYDSRGFLARAFDAHEFAEHGLQSAFVQAYVSITHCRGTIRGLHYQIPPVAEAKLARCMRGALQDVIVDLRPDSPTYMQHCSVVLSSTNHRSVYVPALCAHGMQTLTDEVELFSQSSGFHAPEHERGIRFDDPAFGIEWPLPVTELSDKDASWAFFESPLPAPQL